MGSCCQFAVNSKEFKSEEVYESQIYAVKFIPEPSKSQIDNPIVDVNHKSSIQLIEFEQSCSLSKQSCQKQTSVEQNEQFDGVNFPLKVTHSIGIIKLAKKCYKSQKILAAGILISRQLVMTALDNVLNEKGEIYDNLVFVSKTSNLEYSVSKTFALSHPKSPKNSYLNSCLLRLKQPVEKASFCPLGFQISSNFDSIYTSNFKIIQPCDFKPIFSKINKFSIQKKMKQMIYFHRNEGQSQDGSPIFAFHSNKWRIIGMNNGNDSRKQFSQGVLFTTKIIDYIYNESLPSDWGYIKVYNFREQQFYSMNDRYEQERMQAKKRFAHISKQELKKQEYQHFAKRMTAPLDFAILGRNIKYFTINNTRLYFELEKTQINYTVANLNRDYELDKHHDLQLTYRNITIPLDLPLKLIMKTREDIIQFQNLLIELNSPGLNIKKVSANYLQKLKKVIYEFQAFGEDKKKIRVNIKKDCKLIKSLDYQYNPISTINNLIGYLKQHYQYSFQNYKIFGGEEERRILNHEDFITALGVELVTFKLLDIENYISMTSVVIVGETDFQDKERMTLNSLTDFKQKLIYNTRCHPNLLSYNQQQKFLTYSQLTDISSKKRLSIYYTITYQSLTGFNAFHLHCTEDTLLKTPHDDWILVKNIREGQKLLGITASKPVQLTEYTVIKIDGNSQKPLQSFCKIQMAQNHTFIANNLVVHNDNSIKLKILEHQYGQESWLTNIDVKKDTVIQTLFKGKRVFLGGSELNQNLTFGDYHLQDAQFLQIMPMNTQFIRKTNKLMITQWREGTKECGQYSIFEQQRWIYQYYIIYQGQIREITGDLLQHFFDQKSNILIQRKQYLSRLNFMQKRAKIALQEQSLNKLVKSCRLSPRFNQIQEINRKKRQQLSNNELASIFLYTQSYSTKLLQTNITFSNLKEYNKVIQQYFI